MASLHKRNQVPGLPENVNWERVNTRNAFYKRIDWSTVDFNKISRETMQSIDWLMVNYEEAVLSESFDHSYVDWIEVNAAKKKLKKKVYKGIDWKKLDYHELSNESLDAIDWSLVDYKEACMSATFSLDVVDIKELKENVKVFTKLVKLLRKEEADALLVEASSATLRSIGHNNYSGKISTKAIKAFSADSGDYSLIIRPSSFNRASAIARGMGGKLVELQTDYEASQFVDGLTGITKKRSVARRLSKTMAADGGRSSYVWLGGSDEETEGHWQWSSTGETIAATRSEWGSGKLGAEPDNYSMDDGVTTQNYLAIALENWPKGTADGQGYGDAGQWNDLRGSNKLWFVIEKLDGIQGGDYSEVRGKTEETLPDSKPTPETSPVSTIDTHINIDLASTSQAIFNGNIDLSKLTDQDWKDLGYVVSGEASRGTNDEYGVAASVLNRVASMHFPDTVSGVINAKGQYAAISDGGASHEPELVSKLKSDTGRAGIIEALEILAGRTGFKGQAQLANRVADEDPMFHDSGNFFHYSWQT